VDNLKRGGSDYTASLIGGAIQSEEVQIWTDIDGMHNNDPRIVKNTFPIRELSFAEAAELAYFGAKILHPSTITPAKIKGVPVRLKNTMEPSAFGTLISEKSTDIEITAKEIVKLRGELYEILASHTGQTVEQIEIDSERDKWFRASEAKEYGLIDEVLSKA
jgi:aspartate kinase